jgi:hypothetical protein
MHINVRRIAAATSVVAAASVVVLMNAQAASAATGFTVTEVPYAPSATFNSPLATSADVDGDGRDDIVVARGDSVVVLPAGVGAPVTTPYIGVGAGTHWTRAFAAGDVDDDGDADLVVADTSPTNAVDIVLLHSNGASGTFVAPTVLYGGLSLTTQTAVTVGDVDGDGAVDVLVTRGLGLGGSSWIARGTGGGALGAATLLGTTGFSPRLVDVDGNGEDDLIGWDATVVRDDALRAYASDPSTPVAHESLSSLFGTGPAQQLAVVADLTGDGFVDLVTQNGTTGQIARSTGPGTFSAATPIPFAASTAGPFDVEVDGDVDLLSYDATGNLRVALNDGTGSFALDPLTGLPRGALITGDFDGDALVQIAVLHDLNGPASGISVVTFGLADCTLTPV